MTTYTKAILKLANQQFDFDLKQYSFMKESNRAEYVADNARNLNHLKTALLNGSYYTRVDRVSASGMSRVISIAFIRKNKLQKVDDFVMHLAGCDKNGRIGGCGMDMLFAAQYNLFLKLCPNHRYQKSMASYNYL